MYRLKRYSGFTVSRNSFKAILVVGKGKAWYLQNQIKEKDQNPLTEQSVHRLIKTTRNSNIAVFFLCYISNPKIAILPVPSTYMHATVRSLQMHMQLSMHVKSNDSIATSCRSLSLTPITHQVPESNPVDLIC